MSTKSARARAAEHFTRTLRDDERLQQERDKEQQARTAKVERLRALRLAKEAAERAAAEARASGPKPGKKAGRHD